MKKNMVNIKEVMDTLHELLDDLESGMGHEEIEKFCDCIDALADISIKIRGIGLALKEYGLDMNNVAYERRKGGGIKRQVDRQRATVNGKRR
tara:strand:+ start:123 stop:398 length:276 start_codon:yes stop_codon:yes gene_type:complete